MNLAQLWQQQAAKYGDKTYLYFGDDEYSYNQMLATFYRGGRQPGRDGHRQGRPGGPDAPQRA